MAQENKPRKHRIGELDALYFDQLPQRCKEMFFEFLDFDFPYKVKDKLVAINFIDLDKGCCESPIEQIFAFAYNLLNLSREDGDIAYSLTSQEEIVIGKKKYRADFLFDSDILNEICDSEFNQFKLVIECDGHEFHEKTKKQVEERNTRDMDLKKAGYDVLHFSGSQIFNDPFKCANETLDYILSKIY